MSVVLAVPVATVLARAPPGSHSLVVFREQVVIHSDPKPLEREQT